MTIPADDRYATLRRSVAGLLGADRRRRVQQRRLGALSDAHLSALFVLTEQEEATAGTLASEADLNPASVTAMVDQLEQQGLVERRRDGKDRRQSLISLTDAGRKEVEEQEQYWRRRLSETFADITPEELSSAVKVIELITKTMGTPREVDEGQ